MDIDYGTLYAFAISSTILAISPGPDNIYVLTQSIVHGKKYGLAVVAGLMTGCFFHTTLVAFGVSAIIKQSDTLFFAIKLFGALYVLYLAYKVLKSDHRLQLSETSTQKKSLGQLYKQGLLMNVLNPKVSIFFLAFFPGFLFSQTLTNVVQFYILGLLFVITGVMVFGSIAIAAGTISNYLKRNMKAGYFLKWLQIVVFVGISIVILFSDR
ncbi:LysE family translocator [Aquimarina sp. U1-2]|uniref:LysE family translocator n=1 Tax=Aquimarina sp. U1-2 TaxID=2823141 RepID=UPI001AEC992E|nr:LysE family translocator [Aquimarina sp. U1-2]MBP2832287.1 LysE family translocator [Aquimarina sp. U1-2]